jgi:hypothetical protein
LRNESLKECIVFSYGLKISLKLVYKKIVWLQKLFTIEYCVSSYRKSFGVIMKSIIVLESNQLSVLSLAKISDMSGNLINGISSSFEVEIPMSLTKSVLIHFVNDSGKDCCALYTLINMINRRTYTSRIYTSRSIKRYFKV